MSEKMPIDKHMPRIPSQRRSLERFEHILDSMEQLIEEGSSLEGAIQDIGIYDVAKRAELQPPSIYRLFPTIIAIQNALAQRYLQALMDQLTAAKNIEGDSWQQALENDLRLSCDFYRQRPAAMRLILGANISKGVKAADRLQIEHMAERSAAGLSRWVTGYSTQQLALYAEIVIDITDAIWSQSCLHHGTITEFYLQESIRAASAYLELYMPRYKVI